MFKKIANRLNFGNGTPKEGKGTLVGKIPDGLNNLAVSKEIGKDGGTISVVTASGRTAVVTIPKGALSRNIVITLTPVNPGSSGNSNPDPDEQPDPDQPDPGGQPDPGQPDPGNSNNDDQTEEPGIIITPANLHFDTPAWVDFTWNTSLGTNPASGSDSGSYPDFSSAMPTGTVDLSPLKNIGGIPDSITVGGNQGKAKTAKAKPNSDASVIQSTDGTGKVSIDPVFGGSDGSFGGPINGGGAVQPTNPGKKDAEALLENAAAKSGGKCSEEFLLAASGMMKKAATKEEMSAYSGAIRDCLDVEWLKNLCQNNRIKLRRSYFEQRIPIATVYDEKIADELKRLEEDCVAEYQIQLMGGDVHYNGFVDINGKVCGYLDDTWDVSGNYNLSVSGVVHTMEGKGKFVLPYTGGRVVAKGFMGEHDAYGGGFHIFNMKINFMPFAATFDPIQNNLKSILLYNIVEQPGADIKMSAGECIEQASQPPLEGFK